MNSMESLISAYCTYFIAINSPGPNILAIMTISMEMGRKFGILLAIGIAIGSLMWAIITTIGISSLYILNADVISALKILGAVYMLWLSLKSFINATKPYDIDYKQYHNFAMTDFQYIMRGLSVQLFNPKSAIAWSMIVAIGLNKEASFIEGFALVMGTFFMSCFIHIAYAILFSTKYMIRIYKKMRRPVQFIVGILFALIAIAVLLYNLPPAIIKGHD